MVVTRQFPYHVMRPKQSEQELWAMRCWCTEHIGPQWSLDDRNWGKRNGAWSVIWCGPENFRNYQWMFANQADAVLFALKWS